MMNKEYVKSLIDCVSGIEVKSEAEQIAKYELIEYVEDLEKRIDKAFEIAKENWGKCMYCESIGKILGGKE